MGKLFDVWCMVVRRLEDRINHRSWVIDREGIHRFGWYTRFTWVCDLADWLTGGRCHD